jgi:hypothetical protein
MALVENGFRVGTGVAVGIGAIILAPVILPVASAVVKPVLIAGIKGGMILYQKTSELLAEASETIEDLVAEAKAEVMAEQSPIVSPALSEGEVNQ